MVLVGTEERGTAVVVEGKERAAGRERRAEEREARERSPPVE